MITCAPWKPVNIKKLHPNTESQILKCKFLYSVSWIKEKYNPNTTVKNK